MMVLACLSFPRYSMENSCAFILIVCCISWYTHILTVHDIKKSSVMLGYNSIYGVYQKESAMLWGNVPEVNLHGYDQTCMC